MAVMWPRRIPHEVEKNVLRRAECEVYRRLQSELDDTFTVFYSRPWLGIKPDGEEIDGECDFVIAHPDLGFLAIEVKGGGISYDPRMDVWTSKNKWGIRVRIKNPVAQARGSKYRILDKLQLCPGWQPRRIRARHAVIFPDSERPDKDLGADMPLHLFCFYDDFRGDLHGWVLKRFGDPPDAHGKEQPLGHEGVLILENLLARPFQLHVPLGRMLEQDDRELQILTTQQFHLLRAIEALDRVAISGGAGTGKTVLALEEARRCTLKGLRTLYTCFNSPLAEEVKRRTVSISGLDVFAFHECCLGFIKKAKIPVPDNLPPAVLCRDIYPELLFKALCDRKFEGYNAIIVDEGQDFYSSWWPALECLFAGPGARILRVFYDSNQKVYENLLKLPANLALSPIKLTCNMRNTQNIHTASQQYYEGHFVEALGPEGKSVEWLSCSTESSVLQRAVEKVTRLTVHEKVAPKDIAVLFSDESSIRKSVFLRGIGGIPSSRCERPVEGSVIVDTVSRFKGLESRVVVIVLDRELVLSTEMLYVASTRARTLLIVIGLEKDLNHARGTE